MDEFINSTPMFRNARKMLEEYDDEFDKVETSTSIFIDDTVTDKAKIIDDLFKVLEMRASTSQAKISQTTRIAKSSEKTEVHGGMQYTFTNRQNITYKFSYSFTCGILQKYIAAMNTEQRKASLSLFLDNLFKMYDETQVSLQDYKSNRVNAEYASIQFFKHYLSFIPSTTNEADAERAEFITLYAKILAKSFQLLAYMLFLITNNPDKLKSLGRVSPQQLDDMLLHDLAEPTTFTLNSCEKFIVATLKSWKSRHNMINKVKSVFPEFKEEGDKMLTEIENLALDFANKNGLDYQSIKRASTPKMCLLM